MTGRGSSPPPKAKTVVAAPKRVSMENTDIDSSSPLTMMLCVSALMMSNACA